MHCRLRALCEAQGRKRLQDALGHAEQIAEDGGVEFLAEVVSVDFVCGEQVDLRELAEHDVRPVDLLVCQRPAIEG